MQLISPLIANGDSLILKGTKLIKTLDIREDEGCFAGQ